MLEGKGCTEAKQKACRGRSGPLLEILCNNCEEKDFTPDPYIVGLYHTALLADAGFPFDADTFSFQYWMDLAAMKQSIRQYSMRCPIM
ncbi:MAG: hypothetical protein AB9866_21685 [Syntrophobacteraceae bacterium]